MEAEPDSTSVDFRSACPVSRSLDLMGDKWTLLIMRDALIFDRRTFADFAASSERIPTNLLSQRLKKLVATGLLERRPYHDKPLRYEYIPTALAADLRPVLTALEVFGRRHLGEGD
ncbi:MAG: transcriptional regulator [Proteobacteria bacterium]|nr:transcriptional regulator [Pseudomonadota bacterium]